MSNGTNEPLPGLLDDPHFQIDLPWNDFHIAPLRNPGSQRNANAPSPLEPGAGNPSGRTSCSVGQEKPRRNPNITPSDVLQARESRKPHLAISELVEDNDEHGGQHAQLPSFVSLSVVEKSPTQSPQALGRVSSAGPAQKRLRLDQDVEYTTHDLGRQLPRPAQREQTMHRPAPLLPAMVTGLHEPPPSAALLPSMDPDRRPGAARTTTSSKIQVKDMLTHVDSRSPSPTTAQSRQLPVPTSHNAAARSLPHLDFTTRNPTSTEPTPPSSAATTVSSTTTTTTNTIPSTIKDSKPRRARRKWTDSETHDLLIGARKHGVGKWKQILTDPSFTFHDRSAVDLKDRYRVCAKDEGLLHSLSATNQPTPSNNKPFISTSTPPPSHHPHSTTSTTPSPTSATASRPTSPTPSISTTTTNKPRRKRRAWTTDEDNALLRGVSTHGFQWTVIHDDTSLGLGHRRATDLRDRIRNRFPEGYRRAEVKPLRAEVRRAERQGTERVVAVVGGRGRSREQGEEGEEEDED